MSESRLYYFRARCGHQEPRLSDPEEIARRGREIAANIARLDCASCFRAELRRRRGRRWR